MSAAPYDPIASLYDLHWGHDFAAAAKAAIATHLALPAGAAVLDLCCGTGLILRHLDELGYRSFGVDESANMLAVARRNAPRAQLQHADMAEFSSTTRFDAVVSFYNSVNHARSLDHLRATLANVSGHLKAKGLFLFDYVLPEAFETAWEWSERIDTQDRVWTLRYSYEQASGQATCLINQTDTIRQFAFTPAQIREAMKDAALLEVSDTPMMGTGPEEVAVCSSQGNSKLSIMFVRNVSALATFAPGKMTKTTVAKGDFLFAGLNSFEPGQEHAAHAHAGQDKLYLILEGTGNVTVGNETQQLTVGDAALAPAGILHAIQNPGPGRLVVMAILGPPPA